MCNIPHIYSNALMVVGDHPEKKVDKVRALMKWMLEHELEIKRHAPQLMDKDDKNHSTNLREYYLGEVDNYVAEKLVQEPSS